MARLGPTITNGNLAVKGVVTVESNITSQQTIRGTRIDMFNSYNEGISLTTTADASGNTSSKLFFIENGAESYGGYIFYDGSSNWMTFNTVDNNSVKEHMRFSRATNETAFGGAAESGQTVKINGTLKVSSTSTLSTINSSGIIKTTSTADSTTRSSNSIYTTGGLGVDKNIRAGQNIYSNSDKRIKKKFENINVNLIDEIKGWRYWRTDMEKYQYGHVAQDLYKILPEAVSRPDNDEDLWSVSYDQIIPILVEALKESRKEIKNLKEEIEKIKEDIYNKYK